MSDLPWLLPWDAIGTWINAHLPLVIIGTYAAGAGLLGGIVSALPHEEHCDPWPLVFFWPLVLLMGVVFAVWWILSRPSYWITRSIVGTQESLTERKDQP